MGNSWFSDERGDWFEECLKADEIEPMQVESLFNRARKWLEEEKKARVCFDELGQLVRNPSRSKAYETAEIYDILDDCEPGEFERPYDLDQLVDDGM